VSATNEHLASPLVGSALADAIQAAAKGNSHTATAAAAVLWPDKEGEWQAAIPTLRKLMPGLVELGDYDPELRRGPAVWLKCAIAGALREVQLQGVPVVYLPGVSRSELRAIESCPRDLQPLAELQYRGVFWSQVNSKDWTVSAFLSSKKGGLSLDVAQDRATQEALSQVLEAGALLEQKVADLRERAINSEWLLGLLAPNPTRDVLVWMNDPTNAWNQWNAVRREVFVKRCKVDFGFDPAADGALVAAERLAKCEGKWSGVWELYKDSFASYPSIYGLLAKVHPPQLGLFPDQHQLAGYPQANEQSEAALRYSLASCAGMDAGQARAAILAANKEHAGRRDWLWARMGRSPLATSLRHLAEVAERSSSVPVGQSPSELAASYLQAGWQVDAAAIQALAAVHTKADVESVNAALRAIYLPWSEEAALRLQNAAKGAGGLPALNAETAPKSEPGLCTVFVDGLRYDVAVLLRERLSALGSTELLARWTSLPSVTASGKAWCSPVAAHIAGTSDDVDFEPRVAADHKSLSQHNFRKLLTAHGIQALDKHESGDPQGQAWTEAGDFDHYGHEHGLRLARDLNTQIDQVVERIAELIDAGWKRIHVVTDHGWLLIPGGLPKSEMAKHQTETRWGRCAVLKDSAHGTPLTFGWDWCKDVQVAYAPGVSSFVAGAEYAHGGVSLQECLVPVLRFDSAKSVSPDAAVIIKSVTWKGLRCTVMVERSSPGQRVDIRAKAGLATSSLVASPKAIEAGKASLAVEDDERAGEAAVVVVLGSNGDVLQKQGTLVGEH
jgi:hypothetical protein